MDFYSPIAYNCHNLKNTIVSFLRKQESIPLRWIHVCTGLTKRKYFHRFAGGAAVP